jgi:hypothetical protein
VSRARRRATAGIGQERGKRQLLQSFASCMRRKSGALSHYQEPGRCGTGLLLEVAPAYRAFCGAVKRFDMTHPHRHQFRAYDFAKKAQFARNSRGGF